MADRWVVIVTGSRRLSSRRAVRIVRTDLALFDRPSIEQVIVITGKANGIDEIADREAWLLKYDTLQIPFFHDLGRYGGSARNDCMVEMALALHSYGYKAACLAYPDAESVGTYQCLNSCKRAGFKMKVTKF